MPLDVLLVCKRTSIEAHTGDHADATMKAVLRRGGALADVLRAAHREHIAGVKVVEEALEESGVHWKRVIGVSARRAPGRFDLIVSVGGDGTFLEAARLAGRTPLLGVNSDPARSVGRFCAADRRSFRRLLRLALAERLPAVALSRLQATSGTRTAEALNDLLVAHESPASTSSYVLGIRRGRVRERQRSSGIWISTAAGSTGAIRSAGGLIMPLRSRRLQWLVREPYRGASGRTLPHLRRGFVEPGDVLEIECRMNRGFVYFDGGRWHWRLPLGDLLRVEIAPTPCVALGIR